MKRTVPLAGTRWFGNRQRFDVLDAVEAISAVLRLVRGKQANTADGAGVGARLATRAASRVT
jgi:hypothetical protein